MKLLRQTIRQLLREGLLFRRLKNMCLVQTPNPGATGYTYNLFYPEMIDYIIKNPHLPTNALAFGAHDMMAMMKVKEHDKSWGKDSCLGAWEVSLVSAIDGFGPTLYDIVMGDSPNGLTADRGSVSSAAYDVWDYYRMHREDIKKKPLDWNRRQWTDDLEDDCDWGSDSEAWQQYNSWDDDTYDYIWDDPSVKKGDFLSDPLNWVYNRGPVPNRDVLRYNGEEADKRIKAAGNWDDSDWVRFGRAFFNMNDRE